VVLAGLHLKIVCGKKQESGIFLSIEMNVTTSALQILKFKTFKNTIQLKNNRVGKLGNMILKPPPKQGGCSGIPLTILMSVSYIYMSPFCLLVINKACHQ
jgi:hypothetical protein